MCALIFVFLFSSISFAASPTAVFHNSVKTESGSTGLTSTNSNSTSTITNSIDFNSGSKFSHFEVHGGFDRLKADYSRYIITDRQGNEPELSSQFNQSEFTGRVGTSVFFGRDTIVIDGSKTIGASPFSGFSAGIQATHDFFLSGTKISLNANHADHKTPFSYYKDPENFSPRVLPTRNLENKFIASTEQIMTESLKMKLSIFVTDKPDTRPLQRGGEVSVADAITESSALIGTIGMAREKKSDPLRDDRGYFDANWLQVEYRYFPNFRWEFSSKIGTIFETETARGRLPRQKVGTDSLGLAAKSHWKFGDIGMSALAAKSNTGYRSFSLGGNLSWNI